MRPSPSQLLHAAIGKPIVDGCVPGEGFCYVCSGPIERGKPISDWMASSYTDQNRARCPAASHVCEACCMLAARTFPVPGRPPGKCSVCESSGIVSKIPPKGKGSKASIGDPCPKCGGSGDAEFGGNWRNYCHLYEEGWNAPALPDGTRVPGYVNASKGEKPAVLEFLRRRHTGLWFAAIADSGQKHVVHHCPPNLAGTGGTVLFEETLVQIPPGLELVDEMTTFLTAGATKDEIASGNYTQFSWLRIPDEIRAFEDHNSTLRHGGWFELALWLAQRDEAAVKSRIEAEKAAEKQHKLVAKAQLKEGTTNAKRGRKKDNRNHVGGDADRNQGPVCEGQGWTSETGLPGTDPEPIQVQCRDGANDQPVGKRITSRSSNGKHRHVGQLSIFDTPGPGPVLR